MSQAKEITAKSKSNLAFALIDLPEIERRHMAIFYAFCRLVDDIVDEPGYTEKERHDALDRWIQVVSGKAADTNELEHDVITMINNLALDITPMLKLIEGCRTDIRQTQPRTREELLSYCYCVASCVGLTSATIMGASKQADNYAITLGYALQIVNIIRDFSEDYAKHGRIYLPEEDMEQFGYTREDLKQAVTSPQLQNLLAYEAELAAELFSKAEEYYTALPVDDKNALKPAQAMALIYKTILTKMKQDNFRVFSTRYRVNTLHKLWLLFRARLGIN